MGVGRRVFLTGSVAAVAGCAPSGLSTAPTPTTTPPQPSAPSTPPPSPVETSAAASPTPTTSPTPSVPPAPTRAEIEERYASARPAQWGLEVDGVVLRSEGPQVALTFDACGGPNGSRIDQDLIDVLVASSIPATLFLNARWIDANPGPTRDLIATDLFCIGNHGTRHVPLSVNGQEAYGIGGTASVGEVYDEVMGNQAILTDLMGEAPRFFRPGTAFFDEIAAQIVRDLGLIPVNFDVNADAGATFTEAQVVRATSEASPGSICIAHFNRPDGATAEGMSTVIPRLLDKGLTFARLDELVVA